MPKQNKTRRSDSDRFDHRQKARRRVRHDWQMSREELEALAERERGMIADRRYGFGVEAWS